MINTLEPLNVILANLYIVMLLQLVFNWSAADCNTYSNFYQLVFILTMFTRVIIQQLYQNKGLSSKTRKIVLLITSGIVLTGISIYQSYTLASNSHDFQYDTETKSGSLVCFQNRIVFVAEIIVGFLTVLKDAFTVAMGREGEDESI